MNSVTANIYRYFRAPRSPFAAIDLLRVLEGHVAIRMKSLVVGVILTAMGVFSVGKISDQSHWVPATGTVLSVTEQCEMTASERGVFTKTKYSATIDCDLVEAFEASNSGKNWHVAHIFTGSVRVTSEAAKSVKVEMPLSRVDQRDPKRGDTLDLRQDPTRPEKVDTASAVGSFPIVASIMGGAGLLMSWIGLGSPMVRRRATIDPGDDRGPNDPPIAATTYAYGAPVPAASPAQPAYQSAITDYSRARAAAAPRKAFGRRDA